MCDRRDVALVLIDFKMCDFLSTVTFLLLFLSAGSVSGGQSERGAAAGHPGGGVRGEAPWGGVNKIK